MNMKDYLDQLESKTLEFKEDLPSSRRLAQTVCAFANGAGGKLIIGVRDEPREIMGIASDKVIDYEERISNTIFDSIKPTVSMRVTTHHLGEEDALLLVIEVYPGNLKPSYLKGRGGDEGTYIRVGSTTRRASPEIIQELRRQQRNIGYDSTPAYKVDLDAINQDYIKEYIERRYQVRDIPKAEPNKALLKRIGVLTEEGGELYPSVAGIMLFSDKTGEYYPQAKLKCARFKGPGMGEFLDQKEIVSPLYKQVEEVIGFFKGNVRRGAKIEGIYREERYEYPEVAVREAVTNAICHRDYSISGSDIKFAIFDDRIEVTSPGALPGGLTITKLGIGISEIRNRVIARIFNEMGLVEQWGTGIYRMREAMGEWGLIEPEFREQGNFFKVILWKEPARAEGGRTFPVDLDQDQQVLLFAAWERGRVTTPEGMRLIGKSDRTVQKKLKDLEERGLLRWTGQSRQDPTGYYEPVGPTPKATSK